jgi:hypothetical protein
VFADRVLPNGLLTGLLSGLLDGLPSGLLQMKKYCAMVMMRRSVRSLADESAGLFSRPPHRGSGLYPFTAAFSVAEGIERWMLWIVLP